jgi:acetylornithine deacetylase/succinyl-diaminopimelate desuccinylase-like protein
VMTARADALAAASEAILAVEQIAGERPDAVGTVGEISVRPGAKNVVPGECIFSLDLRSARDHDGLVQEVLAVLMRIASGRGVEVTVDDLARVPVTPLDPRIRDVLRRAAKSVDVDAPELVSGAGHDAQMPALSGVPTGMIFVRSTGGSHTPREFASIDDAALGAQALANAIKELAT